MNQIQNSKPNNGTNAAGGISNVNDKSKNVPSPLLIHDSSSYEAYTSDSMAWTQRLLLENTANARYFIVA